MIIVETSIGEGGEILCGEIAVDDVFVELFLLAAFEEIVEDTVLFDV